MCEGTVEYTHSITLSRASKIIEWYRYRGNYSLQWVCTRRSLRLCLSISLRLHCMCLSSQTHLPGVTPRTMRIIILRENARGWFLAKWRLRTSEKPGDARLLPREDVQRGGVQGKKEIWFHGTALWPIKRLKTRLSDQRGLSCHARFFSPIKNQKSL